MNAFDELDIPFFCDETDEGRTTNCTFGTLAGTSIKCSASCSALKLLLAALVSKSVK